MEGRDIEEEEERQQQSTCTQVHNNKILRKGPKKEKSDSGEVLYMHGSHVGQQLHVCTHVHVYM